jgi:hypothetical protein
MRAIWRLIDIEHILPPVPRVGGSNEQKVGPIRQIPHRGSRD